MESETWVVVSKIENMLLPRKHREYATHNPRTGEWIGWTTPGYRSRKGPEIDSFQTLKDAVGLVRQVRLKYPHATAALLSMRGKPRVRATRPRAGR